MVTFTYLCVANSVLSIVTMALVIVLIQRSLQVKDIVATINASANKESAVITSLLGVLNTMTVNLTKLLHYMKVYYEDTDVLFIGLKTALNNLMFTQDPKLEAKFKKLFKEIASIVVKEYARLKRHSVKSISTETAEDILNTFNEILVASTIFDVKTINNAKMLALTLLTEFNFKPKESNSIEEILKLWNILITSTYMELFKFPNVVPSTRTLKGTLKEQALLDIRKGNPIAAIEKLLLVKVDISTNNKLILLQSNFVALLKNIDAGTMSIEQVDISRAKLNDSLLKLIQFTDDFS